jgi:hypothetical protein
LQGIDRRQRYDKTRFHVECSGAPSAPCRNPERRLLKCAERIDSVEVAEHQDLAVGVASAEPDLGPHMIATHFLAENADPRTSMAPLLGHDACHAVYRRLIVAGRFTADKLTEQSNHCELAVPQIFP